MSCVWKNPKSPFWIAQFTDASGTRVNRSTKQTNRRTAEGVAAGWEGAALKARMGELTQTASIKVLSQMMEITTGDTLHVESIESFFRGWLRSRTAIGRADATAKRYSSVIDGFLESLDARRRKGSIGSLTASEIERWRDAELSKGKGSTTADYGVKVLRAVLNAARRKGLVLANAAEGVESIGDAAQEREPFTPEELRSLLRDANEEWRGMILFGAHCGLRLADAASLTWSSIDLKGETLTFLASKAKKKSPKPLRIALHRELVEYLRKLSARIGLAPLFPSLAGRKPGSHGGLSNEFSRLMVKAGVEMRRGEKKTCVGGSSAGRQFRSKGFHSLRHTMISRFADAEVSADVRRAIAGHSSDTVHRKYVHLSIENQRAAVSKLAALGAV